MSIPAPSNPLHGTPQEALGLSDNPLPTPPHAPHIGGSKSARRRRSGPPGSGIASRGVRSGPPGTQSASERRAQAKANLHIVRPQPKETPSPAPATPQPGRTAAGAPADRPRQVPKTGRTEGYRESMRHVLGKDAERQYHGMPAASQEVMNKIMRHHGGETTAIYDQAGRATMQDHLDNIRGNRKSRVADAVRQARETHDAPPEDKGPIIEHGPREAPDPETRARRAAQYKKMRETLDQPPTS